MQQGDKSGDGRTSPFGGGAGGRGVGSGMAGSGNNFITNPGGTPSSTHGTDPTVYNRPQPKARPDINTQDAAPGGAIPQAAPPASRPGGVGTIGNPARPYKLSGG
jgi:hypothetical protein